MKMSKKMATANESDGDDFSDSDYDEMDFECSGNGSSVSILM